MNSTPGPCQPALAAAAPVEAAALILVSHGFQRDYERGFCRGLAAAGMRATLICSDDSGAADQLPGIVLSNLRGSQDPGRTRLAKLFNMLRYHVLLCLRVLRQPRAVVHVFGLIDPPLLCGVIEGLWFRLCARRYVLTVHNLLPHDRHGARNRRLYGWAYRLPHVLVVHTARMRSELMASYGVPAQRIVVMEHGLEAPPADWRLPAPELSGHPLRLLFFGKVLPYKGLDVLLAALALPGQDCTLTIAGACPSGALRRELEAVIAAHPAAASIRWRCEFIPDQEVAVLFAQAQALVLPYRHIDQSGVLFQALRFGLPVVASQVGAFVDYVGADIGETCRPEDPLALRQAIDRLAVRLASLSRARICAEAARFSWSLTVQSLAPAYALTAGNSPRAAR